MYMIYGKYTKPSAKLGRKKLKDFKCEGIKTTESTAPPTPIKITRCLRDFLGYRTHYYYRTSKIFQYPNEVINNQLFFFAARSLPSTVHTRLFKLITRQSGTYIDKTP